MKPQEHITPGPYASSQGFHTSQLVFHSCPLYIEFFQHISDRKRAFVPHLTLTTWSHLEITCSINHMQKYETLRAQNIGFYFYLLSCLNMRARVWGLGVGKEVSLFWFHVKQVHPPSFIEIHLQNNRVEAEKIFFSTYGGGAGANSSLYSSRSLSDTYLSADTSLLGSSSRYLSAESLSSSAISSSMLYNPDSYSIRVPGISITTSTHSYGPPGVDVGSSVVSTESLYAGLKRSSSESLYYQTLLGAHNKIGQTEAWYSTNPLGKRLRYESTSHLPIYPQRPGEKDCAYYMQTRTCKFGDSCKFDHPIWVPEGGIPDWKEVPPVPSESLPERPGEPDCPYFLKTQRCKFGIRCKFNHPKDRIVPPGAPEDGDICVLPERPSEPPCTFYMKTGQCKFGATCKFHHPKGVQIQSAEEENNTEVQNKIFGDAKSVQSPFAPALLHNSKGLPIRPGEEDCPFYLKTGSCKYGATCRYNHPDRYSINPPAAALAPTLLTSPSAHFNIGVVAPTASLLPTFDPTLSQTTLGLAPTIYPQRPGQLACDYYMKTGICKFGSTCKFHHPLDRSGANASVTESVQENVKLTLAGLPRREGAIHCPYYMKTGMCKYGATCKFDHPPPGEVMAVATSQAASSSAVGEGKQNGDV